MILTSNDNNHIFVTIMMITMMMLERGNTAAGSAQLLKLQFFKCLMI